MVQIVRVGPRGTRGMKEMVHRNDPLSFATRAVGINPLDTIDPGSLDSGRGFHSF